MLTKHKLIKIERLFSWNLIKCIVFGDDGGGIGQVYEIERLENFCGEETSGGNVGLDGQTNVQVTDMSN